MTHHDKVQGKLFADVRAVRELVGESARVGGVYVVAQVPAFFIPVAIAATFGATSATDSLFLALAIASFVVNSVSGAALAAVPFFVREGEQVIRFGNAFLVAIAVGLLLVALLVTGPALERWSDLDPAERRAAAVYIAALGPYVLCSTLAALWSAAMNARREYRVPGWVQGVRSVAVVGLVLGFGTSFGLWGLVLAFFAGELLRALILRAVLYYGRISQAPRPAASADRSVDSREFARSLVAQVAGSAVLGTVPIIDRLMASSLGPGSVSVLEYAERIWQAPLFLAMTGFTVVSLTEWSRDARTAASSLSVRQQAAATARVLFVVSLPFCLAFVLLREPIVGLFFGYGAFPEAELPRLADTLGALVAGVPVYLVGLTYSRVYLAERRSLVLFAVACIGVATKIALNVLLLAPWGVTGLGIATSLMYAMTTLLLATLCRKLPDVEPNRPRNRAARPSGYQ